MRSLHVNVIVKDEFTNQIPLQSDSDRRIEVKFDDNDFNFDLDLTNIEKVLKHKIHPVIMDLYRIASTVYISDLQSLRPARERTRNFNIFISVSDKAKWEAQKQHLESMLRFLSGDSFNFHFVQGRFPEKEFLFKAIKHKKAISLFSGGLDSFSGVKWLIDNGYSPIIVSHASASNILTHVQDTLYDKLREIIPNLEIAQVKARSRKLNTDNPGLRAKEYTQKTRSFLFLSLGSIFALENGIKEIFLFENGILALNIPITVSRIFTNTKTAHPRYVKDFNTLVNSLFPNSIYVKNPFSHMTKGETISILDDVNYRNLIKETITCSRFFQLQIRPNTSARHCGICIPCILRRVSVHHANLWDYDVQYADDILDSFDNIDHNGQATLLELLYFLRKLEKDVQEVLTDIPEFYVEEYDPADAIELMKRYGVELKKMINDKGSDTLISNMSTLEIMRNRS